MKVIVVYLGQGSLNNFAHSIQSGVWGFKNKGQPTETFGPGDTIFFASGYTGSNIRIPEREWLTHSIGLVATAEIVSPLRVDDTPHWPDEIVKNEVVYRRRFNFRNLRRKDGKFPLGDVSLFPLDLVLAIRKAASSSGRRPCVCCWLRRPIVSIATSRTM